jgi:hypothetical protein
MTMKAEPDTIAASSQIGCPRSGRDGDKRCQYEGGVHHRSRFELLTEIVSPGRQSDTNSSTSTTLAIWLSSFIDS